MSINATRLTSFAMISAIEMDCRDAILSLDTASTLAWPEAAFAAATGRAARARVAAEGNVEVLVQFLDFADSYQILLAHKSHLPAEMLESLSAVNGLLEPLIRVRNRVAHSRPMEIGDLETVTDVAETLVRHAPHQWPSTKETLSHLRRDPAFVLGLTVQLPIDPRIEPQHNLPIPDFDETGFIGRSKEIQRVKRALLGPYPVVSILGDGGIGKTAIALRVAYDLLDTEKSPFDAIVWASAKSTTLTNSEIAGISGAIHDSLGLFEAAARELAGVAAERLEDPITEVLQYLEEFRILLILDNLETVTDRRLRDFLLELPNGSKVLLTSRIGLGIENPVKLEPLSEVESKRLLKTLAGLRSVSPLLDLDDAATSKLVTKLRGHPLYIKWLVAGVQAGKRPAELVNDNSLLLDFCMSNVWDKLSSDAKRVLQTMQIARGQLSLGELAELSDSPADKIQSAVLELMTTNFVAMKKSAEAELDGVFETGEFASQYLSKHQPPPQALRSSVTTKLQELERLGRELIAERGSDPYSEFTIDVRDKANVPTARLLHKAIRELRAENYDSALQYCGQAATLAPTYAEVWRIQGLVNLYRGDLTAAAADSERALEYAERSPVMAVHHARLLHHHLGDSQGAIDALKSALQSEPNNPVLLFEFGQVMLDCQKYQEAIGATSLIAPLPQVHVHAAANALLCMRAGSYGTEDLLYNGNYVAAIELLEETLVVMEKIGTAELDEESADWLTHLAQLADRTATGLSGETYLAQRAHEFAAAYRQLVRTIDPAALARRTGHVVRVEKEKRFGFLREEESDRFFHRNDVVNREYWQYIAEGTIIAFDPAVNFKGPKVARARVLL